MGNHSHQSSARRGFLLFPRSSASEIHLQRPVCPIPVVRRVRIFRCTARPVAGSCPLVVATVRLLAFFPSIRLSKSLRRAVESGHHSLLWPRRPPLYGSFFRAVGGFRPSPPQRHQLVAGPPIRAGIHSIAAFSVFGEKSGIFLNLIGKIYI